MARSTADQHWMDRAFALAENGRWNTAPNPRVGCVIVSGDQAIAEGWHAQWGGDHAEVDALKQLDASDPRLAEATAYVSLEPCNHHGRTPPCTELLIQRGIPRVVVGMQDPDPRVAGSGIDRLRGAGIEVVVLNGQTSGTVVESPVSIVAGAGATLGGAQMRRQSRWICRPPQKTTRARQSPHHFGTIEKTHAPVAGRRTGHFGRCGNGCHG